MEGSTSWIRSRVLYPNVSTGDCPMNEIDIRLFISEATLAELEAVEDQLATVDVWLKDGFLRIPVSQIVEMHTIDNDVELMTIDLREEGE